MVDWVKTVQLVNQMEMIAGLCSQETCRILQKASKLLPAISNEAEADKLSLALEPESAAIYCQSMSEKLVAAYCAAQKPYQSKCYLVVDIGGGTVDISAHKVSSSADRHIQVVHPPTGNDCGGSRVNKAFQDFLAELVRDKQFSRYLRTSDPVMDAKHEADLNDLINKTFEEQKIMFGSKGGVGSKLSIRLPFTFLEEYKNDIDDGIRQKGDSRLKLVGQDLRIEYSKMADFLHPVVEGVLECMSQTLTNVEARIDTIYLVGGFGGSCYIYKRITERFGNGYKYITPAEPDFAVIRGAVLFRQNLNIVRARKADATYGIEILDSFNSEIHDPEYKWIDDDNQERCLNLFSTIVEKGDVVCTEQVFTEVYGPSMHQQRALTFKVYSTLEKDVWYTTGRRGKGSKIAAPMNLRKIGEFEVHMPNLNGDKNRQVDVTFDFSHTEIQVKGYDRTSGNEVKVTLDFLSA